MDDLILKTSHLILRYQRKSDIKFLVDLWMDEDNTKYVGGPREKQFLIDEFRSGKVGRITLEFPMQVEPSK